MNDAESDITKEVCFLLAKFLKAKFPMISDEFIQICEERGLFPSCVFSQRPSFSDLENWSLSGIPDDQIIRLAQLASPKSAFASVLFKNPAPFPPLSASDSLIHALPPSEQSDLTTWSPVRRIVGHMDKVFCVCIDATSQLVITGSDDARVKIWDLANMSLIESLPFHTGVITETCIHPSNCYFATSSHDFTVDFCDLIHGQILTKIHLPCEIHMIKFSPCGTYLAAALQEGTVRLWKVVDILNGRQEMVIIPTISGKSAAWLDFSRCGEFLLYSGDPDELNVYSISREEIRRLVGHGKLPEYAQFSRKSCETILSLASKDKSLRIWRSGKKLWSDEIVLTTRGVLNGSTMKFLRACWNCDESRLIAISNTCLYVWETVNYEVCHRITDVFTEQASVLVPHPFLREIVFVGCQSGRCSLWDIMEGQLIVPLQLEDTPKVSEARWTPDGSALVVADELWGFTIMRRNVAGGMTTVEQFFLSETMDNIADDKSKICDIHGVALTPPLQRKRLCDMKLDVYPKQPSYQAQQEEQEALAKWDPRHSDVFKLREVMARKSFKRSQSEQFTDIEIPEETPVSPVEPEEPQEPQNYEVIEDYVIYNDPAKTPRMSARKKPKSYTYEDESEELMEEPLSDEEPIRPRRRGRTQTHSDSDFETEEPIEEPPVRTRVRPRKSATQSQPKSKKTKKVRTEPRERRERKPREIDSDFVSDFEDSDDERKPPSRYSPPPKSKQATRHSLRLKGVEPEPIELEVPAPQAKEEPPETPPKKSTGTIIRIPGRTKKNTERTHSKKKKNIVLPEWMWAHERLRYTYIPQLGEEVVYFRRGHEDSASDCVCDIFTPPYVKYPKLGQVAYATVSNVEFFVDHLLVSLSFDKGRNGQIYWPIPATPNFLVARSFYDLSMQFVGNLAVGDTVSVYFVNEKGEAEPWEAKVAEISRRWERSPYNSVTVQWLDTKYKDPAEVSPWELTFGETKPRKKSDMAKLMQSFTAAVRRAVNDDAYGRFLNFRENQEPFVTNALKPIDLLLLEQRLQSEWYTTVDELIYDIRQLAVIAEPMGLDQEAADNLVVDLLSSLAKYMSKNKITAPEGFDPKVARV